MRSLRKPALAAVLVAIAACSTPPQPPTVDESQKRPVNSTMAIELQVCRNDLHNTRLLATQSSRLADRTSATLASLAVRQQALAALEVPTRGSSGANGAPAQANTVYTVRFDFGSSRVVIPTEVGPALAAQAKSAPLVMLRGRTDGTADTPGDSRIARERAAAVRDWLVAAGVDAARIRATHQPAGDLVAENGSPAGRQLNRRVEIELYRVLPVALAASGTLP